MNAKHYTTIEQGKKLLELGLSPETADMYFSLWEEDPDFKEPYMVESAPFEWEEIPVYDRALPSWSLGALLEVMPGHSNIYKGDEKDDYKYVCAPISRVKEHYGNTPIEAAYSMIVWLLENGCVKKESDH